ncbi:hypothetical protein BGZ81_001944 [Podila clonocystis]|nr:hypothetical protein BGZ81_001944 [Podila clonocystis]
MTIATKACISKGKTACTQGFFREPCTKCTRGSTVCSICIPPKHNHQHEGLVSPSRQSLSPSSATSLCSGSSSNCLFCIEGQKVCEDCFGLGFVQRICQDCIKDHYRKQSSSSSLSSSSPSQFQVLSPSEQRKMLVCHSMISLPPPSSSATSLDMATRNCSSLSLERSECDYSDDASSSSSSSSSISSQKSKGKLFSIRSMITRRVIRLF